MSLKPVGELISISRPSEFQWIINTKEFDSKKKNEPIRSPTLFVNNTIQNMHLEFYPKGLQNSNNGEMGLLLVNDNDYDVTLQYSFSLLNKNDEKVNTKKLKNDTISSKCKWGYLGFTRGSFVFDPANKLITDDKITIVCTIFERDINAEKKYQNLKEMNKKLATNKKYSDVTINCRGNQFYLHKCILATRSSVFAAMFETDVMEKSSNMVTITDIDPKVLLQFFRYLYTNTLDDFKEVAEELLFVADKYSVKDLKDECEEKMCDNIKTDNAIKYFKIADIFNANKLKSEVVRFMAQNRDKLKNNTELVTLSKEQLLELYQC